MEAWYDWVGLIVLATISFWCQAVVTEECFVLALNVISVEFNIPDDIAGATLMAAGASSPELFSSFVALFITHSALGLGTVVGSEIFNQLIICAGAVYAAKSETLQLDKAIVLRETFFYGLSIGLLLYSLHDFQDGHIYISFLESIILFGTYCIYVWVMAKFAAVHGFFSKTTDRLLSRKKAGGRPSYGAVEGQQSGKSKRTHINILDMPFLKETYASEPKSNFEDNEAVRTETFFRTKGGEKLADKIPKDEETKDEEADVEIQASTIFSMRKPPSFLEISMRYTLGKFSDGASIRLFQFLIEDERPSNQHELRDLEINAFEERLSCFMWQRSYFYNKARFAVNGWHLRWFTLTADAVHSVPDRADYLHHRITYPPFVQIEVDEDRQIVKIINPIAGKRDIFLMAPSK